MNSEGVHDYIWRRLSVHRIVRPTACATVREPGHEKHGGTQTPLPPSTASAKQYTYAPRGHRPYSPVHPRYEEAYLILSVSFLFCAEEPDPQRPERGGPTDGRAVPRITALYRSIRGSVLPAAGLPLCVVAEDRARTEALVCSVASAVGHVHSGRGISGPVSVPVTSGPFGSVTAKSDWPCSRPGRLVVAQAADGP